MARHIMLSKPAAPPVYQCRRQTFSEVGNTLKVFSIITDQMLQAPPMQTRGIHSLPNEILGKVVSHTDDEPTLDCLQNTCFKLYIFFNENASFKSSK